MTRKITRPFILWAEDDFDDLCLIREILKDISCEADVTEAGNGQEVINYLHAACNDGLRLPDLIVLDMNMPILGGRETLRQIVAHPQFQSINKVIFTTSQNDEDKKFCRNLQTEMISKPTTFLEFRSVVEKLVCVYARKN